MRLWHKDLISVLPRQQLLGQWRECCAIAKAIDENGSPNHVLVNRIMDFDLSHFFSYGLLVFSEITKRGYNCDISKFLNRLPRREQGYRSIDSRDIFPDWHGTSYMDQCFYNLQEKYDCGTITEEDWRKIQKLYWEYYGLVG